MDKDALFTERQSFRQIWLWIILFGINGLFAYGIYGQVFIGQPFGDNPMSDSELVITFGLSILLTFLFIFLRLDTQIKQDGIYVRFFPFQLKFKKYSWDKISKSYVRQYSPISEYGGWGLRLGLFGHGRAFNISGNKGIQLELTNGKRLLIGTKKPDKAKQTLRELGHSND